MAPAFVHAGLFFMSLESVATAEVFFLSFTNKEQLPQTSLQRLFLTQRVLLFHFGIFFFWLNFRVGLG